MFNKRMDRIERDRLFVALTRPQMFAGVTYNYFVINAILAAELFLIFRSLWVLAFALVVHGVGVLLCLGEPRAVDLWLARSRLCGRVPNHGLWRCNSYRP
jgi:type IV secretion system protein VirB3